MCSLDKYCISKVLLQNWQFLLNTLRPRQSGHHFAHDIFKRIFLKENVRISIEMSLKFVPKSPNDNIPALFQIMAWRRPGDKPLSEAMMVSLLTHICVARPQWVNSQSKQGIPCMVRWDMGFLLCVYSWGQVTHICVDKLTNIGLDNGLSPSQRQVIWTNAGILLIFIYACLGVPYIGGLAVCYPMRNIKYKSR